MNATCLLAVTLLAAGVAAVMAHAADTRPAAEPEAALGPLPAEMARWTEQDRAAQRDAAVRLLADLEAAAKHKRPRFVIPPGHYRFSGPDARHFGLTGASDLEIVGEGVTLWLGNSRNVKFKACQRLTLRGLTVDSETVPWTQGTIVAMDPEHRTLDLRIHDGYVMPDPAAKRSRTIFFDARGQHERGVQDDNAMTLHHLDERTIRIDTWEKACVFHNGVWPEPVRVGDQMALLLRGGGRSGGVAIDDCAALTFEDITLHGPGGFGFHEIGGVGGHTYRRCRLVRRPGTNRLMAGGADGFHSMQVQQGPRLEQCEIANTGDDLLAIHGFFSVVLEKRSPRQWVLASPFGPTVAAGTSARFHRSKTGEPLGEATVVSIAALPELRHEVEELPKRLAAQGIRARNFTGDAQLVTFDRDVDARAFDTVASDFACGGGAVVRNCYLHDGHVRGLLCKTHDLLVEDTRFENISMGAMIVGAEMFWVEGPFNSRITLRRNTIRDCGRGGSNSDGAIFYQGVVDVGAWVTPDVFPKTLAPFALNDTIRITGNTIVNAPAIPILISSCRNVLVEDNVIEHPCSKPPAIAGANLAGMLKDGPAVSGETLGLAREPFFGVFVQASRDVAVRNNAVRHPPAWFRGPVGVGAWNQNIRVEN